MSLENKVHSNPNISKGVRAAGLPLILAAFVLAFGSLVGCSPPIPRFVEAEYYILPSTAHDGEEINWGVRIINPGNDPLKVNTVTNYQEVMSGPDAGYSVNNDLTHYVTTEDIPAKSTQTIIDRDVTVYNSSRTENVKVEGEVTVNFDDGSSVTSNRASITVLHQ